MLNCRTCEVETALAVTSKYSWPVIGDDVAFPPRGIVHVDELVIEANAEST